MTCLPGAATSPIASDIDAPARRRPNGDTAMACTVSATGSGTDTTSLGGVGGSYDRSRVRDERAPIGVSLETTLAARRRVAVARPAAHDGDPRAVRRRCTARRWHARDRGRDDRVGRERLRMGPFVSAPEVLCPPTPCSSGSPATGIVLAVQHRIDSARRWPAVRCKRSRSSIPAPTRKPASREPPAGEWLRVVRDPRRLRRR